MLNLAVFVSGNGTHLQCLKESGHSIVAVVCNNPNAAAVKKAEAFGLAIFCHDYLQYNTREEWECRVEEYLLPKNVDLIVLAGFMRVLSPSFVAKRPKGVINIHPSLLPSFPGKNAIQQALDYGVKLTGATVHYVDAGVDTGPILFQEAVAIIPWGNIARRATKDELRTRLQEVEGQLLLAALDLIDQETHASQSNRPQRPPRPLGY